eukprot:SAG11_NODE_74_length_18043_cov_13.387818_22_plen_83_part_00
MRLSAAAPPLQAGSLAVGIARALVAAALARVELGPPRGRPADGVGTRRQCGEIIYYWEPALRAGPTLLLNAPATVLVTEVGT